MTDDVTEEGEDSESTIECPACGVEVSPRTHLATHMTSHEKSNYDDAEFIGAVRDLPGTPTTSEVADTIGCCRDTARKWLRRLEDRDIVGRGEPGWGDNIWYLTDEAAGDGGNGDD